MSEVSRSAEVAWTAAEMYALVNDVAAYPRFLPWCTAAEVHESTPERLRASVSLSAGRIHQSFTTENTMIPGQRIDVHLLSGPFSELEGHWKFTDLAGGGSRVELWMAFEFRNRLLKMTLTPIFDRILNSLVGAFVERARAVYGPR